LSVDLPPGWDGVLARALAPQPQARFSALSEFQQALQRPARMNETPPLRRRKGYWRLVVAAALGLLLLLGIGLGR
jgi:hypothetical protein